MKEKNTHTALRAFAFITLGLFLLPSVNAQGPPVEEDKPCLFYGYSQSMNHYFLVENNSIMFGDNITFVHNCEFITILEEGNFLASSNYSVSINIEPGKKNLTISTNEKTQYFQIEVIPDRLEWEYEYSMIDYQQPTELISIDLSNTRENWAVVFSIVIVWLLATSVYWKLIQSYVNKNFIEEVVK